MQHSRRPLSGFKSLVDAPPLQISRVAFQGMKNFLKTLLLCMAHFNLYMARSLLVRRNPPQVDMLVATAIGSNFAVAAMSHWKIIGSICV